MQGVGGCDGEGPAGAHRRLLNQPGVFAVRAGCLEKGVFDKTPAGDNGEEVRGGSVWSQGNRTACGKF